MASRMQWAGLTVSILGLIGPAAAQNSPQQKPIFQKKLDIPAWLEALKERPSPNQKALSLQQFVGQSSRRVVMFEPNGKLVGSDVGFILRGPNDKQPSFAGFIVNEKALFLSRDIELDRIQGLITVIQEN